VSLRARAPDFGLSRNMDVQTRVETRTYGTITHMAPEVLRANIVSKAADVYSFGVILWEMAAGCRAWVGAPPPSLACSSFMRFLPPCRADSSGAWLVHRLSSAPSALLP
jgi:serine/threonine protein kinase